MGADRLASQDGGVARLLIFWTHPSHLAVAEADTWARAELAKITGLATVDRAELTRLRTTSFGCPHDWMLELHLADGARPADCIEAQACADWVGDMRLLGMHPTVVAVDSRDGDD
jgi:hypothetical protein